MAEPDTTRRDNAAMNSTDMSFERTLLSHERTLMSWIRTSTSMITFGFTIYKVLEETVQEPGEKLFTPRLVGMSMIFIGLLGLFLAQLQHHAARRKLKTYNAKIPTSISSLLAYIILFFGVILFIGAWYRQ